MNKCCETAELDRTIAFVLNKIFSAHMKNALANNNKENKMRKTKNKK